MTYFVDTNVLVYARDATEPEKHRQAQPSRAFHRCASLFLTEDLQHDQVVDGVRIVDPFGADTPGPVPG